jgi:Flp pilus assembly pilin Flp
LLSCDTSKITLKSLDRESGQAGLELVLLITFIVVGLVVTLSFFFPEIKRSFIGVGNLLENALETGPKFK